MLVPPETFYASLHCEARQRRVDCSDWDVCSVDPGVSVVSIQRLEGQTLSFEVWSCLFSTERRAMTGTRGEGVLIGRTRKRQGRKISKESMTALCTLACRTQQQRPALTAPGQVQVYNTGDTAKIHSPTFHHGNLFWNGKKKYANKSSRNDLRNIWLI